MKKFLCSIGFLVSAMLLAACSGATAPYALAPTSALPDFLDHSSPEVREAYRFAVMNQEELMKYPCYCGCNVLGHMDNRDCYINPRDTSVVLKYDTHASGCQICVDITRDVMRLLREGQTSARIRAYIDATYSAFGPPTNTPLVE